MEWACDDNSIKKIYIVQTIQETCFNRAIKRDTPHIRLKSISKESEIIENVTRPKTFLVRCGYAWCGDYDIN